MDEIVTIHAAKTNLSRLVARAEAGEEIIIARGNKPVAKLVPIIVKPKRVFGALRGKFEIGPEFFEPLPPDELEAWEQAPDATDEK
jgi:prevent-host-death family protein